MTTSSRCEKDLRALNIAYIMLLRASLRQHFGEACRVLRMGNRRTAQKIEALDTFQVQRLGEILGTNIIEIDEALVLEALVKQAVDGGAPCAMQTRQVEWRVGGEGDAEMDAEWRQGITSLQFGLLMLLKNWLCVDEKRAVVALNVRNRQFIRRVESMDMGQLMQLAGSTSRTFMVCTDTLPFQALIDRLYSNGVDDELRMSVMAQAACGFSRCPELEVAA